jgi:pyrophosphatase PpaX
MAAGRSLDWAAVLFDLDGTLADTVELILRCYRHTMEVHLGNSPPDERWLSGIGTPLTDQLRAFACDREEALAMARTYSAFQRTIHDQMVSPFPGTVEMVAALRARGVVVGVVTSKRREVAGRTLARCGFADAYEVLVCADDVTRGKPDPEPVLLALRRLGLSQVAGRSLFVGDSPHDLKAGRAAGTKTAAALWGPFAHDVLRAEAADFYVGEPGDVLSLEP